MFLELTKHDCKIWLIGTTKIQHLPRLVSQTGIGTCPTVAGPRNISPIAQETLDYPMFLAALSMLARYIGLGQNTGSPVSPTGIGPPVQQSLVQGTHQTPLFIHPITVGLDYDVYWWSLVFNSCLTTCPFDPLTERHKFNVCPQRKTAYKIALTLQSHEKKIGHRDCSPWAHGDQNGHSQPWLSRDLGHDWAVT